MSIAPGLGKAVIEPHEYKVEVPCERFILVFTEYPIRVAKRLMVNVESVSLHAPTLDSIKGIYEGVEVCITRLYFGAPVSVIALELLIAAGAKNFIVVGMAGSLHPRLRIGDILIPTWGRNIYEGSLGWFKFF